MKKVKKTGKKRRLKKTRIIASILGLLLVIDTCALVYVAVSSYPTRGRIEKAQAEIKAQEEAEEAAKSSSFTFVGVGDNLIHEAIYYYDEGTCGTYNFEDVYENTADYTQNADLAYINLETLLTGRSEEELSGYPTFNGPVEFLDAINKAGFDWLAIASNHALDTGASGLIEQQEIIKEEYPEMVYTGSNTSEEERNTPKVIDVNGIKVGIQGYTYGTNGIPVPEDMPWLIQVYVNDDGSINYDMMKEDLDRLKEVSDVQIVSMHWGVEYQTEPNEEQKEIAQFLNEQGVEVIIGSHPHVIQPVEIIHGDTQDTLCYYSLGNYVSAQDNNFSMVGGLASFGLNYNFETGETTFTDVKFVPTVTYFPSDFSYFTVFEYNDWNDELAATSKITTVDGQDMSREWIASFVTDVLGNPEGVEVVME